MALSHDTMRFVISPGEFTGVPFGLVGRGSCQLVPGACFQIMGMACPSPHWKRGSVAPLSQWDIKRDKREFEVEMVGPTGLVFCRLKNPLTAVPFQVSGCSVHGVIFGPVIDCGKGQWSRSGLGLRHSLYQIVKSAATVELDLADDRIKITQRVQEAAPRPIGPAIVSLTV